MAGGQIELSREGSNTWQALPTQLEGGRLVARIDDAALPPGRYLLRAQATDLAGNVGVAAAPQPLTLPLRIQSALQAGVVKTKIVRKKVAQRRPAQAPHRAAQGDRAAPGARVRYGDRVTIAGRLTNRDGQPLPGQQIQVLGPGPSGEQLLAVLTTDAQGGYSYRAAGSASRTLRFVYPGSADGAARREPGHARRARPRAASSRRASACSTAAGSCSAAGCEPAAAGGGQAGRAPGQAADRRVDHVPHAAHRRPGTVGAALPLPVRALPHHLPAAGPHPGRGGLPVRRRASRAAASVTVRGAQGPCP